MRLKSVAQYLEEQGLGKFGTDIFVTEMPRECQRGILLMDTYSGTGIDPYLPGWRDTGFRLVVRHSDYESGDQLGERASAALNIRRDITMGVNPKRLIMRQCLPVNDPRPYRRSEASVWEFEVDFECTCIYL